MLDFFKDMYLEVNGIEPKEVKKKEKDEKIIFNFKTKIGIWFMGIIYMIIGISSIALIIRTQISINIIKYIMLIIVDLIILICISIKRKNTETIALVGIIIFIVINLSTAFI